MEGESAISCLEIESQTKLEKVLNSKGDSLFSKRENMAINKMEI